MSKNVLVVDDRPDTLNLIKFALEKRGYSVITAENGEECLKKLNENIDIVLLDVMMPKMSGEDVLIKIRENKDYDKIKVIILTAVKFSKESQDNFIKLGAQDFLSKPVSIEQLEEVLKKLVK